MSLVRKKIKEYLTMMGYDSRDATHTGDEVRNILMTLDHMAGMDERKNLAEKLVECWEAAGDHKDITRGEHSNCLAFAKWLILGDMIKTTEED